MTRNNADFQQSVLLHRGFSDVSSLSEIDTNNLGSDWSTNPEDAKVYASWGDTGQGLTISAKVNPKDVEGGYEDEEHRTVKRGAKVIITSHGNVEGKA